MCTLQYLYITIFGLDLFSIWNAQIANKSTIHIYLIQTDRMRLERA